MACRADSAPSPAEAPGSPPASAAAYTVAGVRIGLAVEAGGCWLTRGEDGQAGERIELTLRPPCYLLTWQARPPTRSGAEGLSDGLPVGDVGDPMAWKDPSAGGVVALAVIGDPVPEEMRSSDLHRTRQRQGYRCAASMQGALLVDRKVRLSKKRDQAGLFCLEVGAEEKDSWILAHD